MRRQGSDVFILFSLGENSRHPADKNTLGRCPICSPSCDEGGGKSKREALIDGIMAVDFCKKLQLGGQDL